MKPDFKFGDVVTNWPEFANLTFVDIVSLIYGAVIYGLVQLPAVFHAL